MVDKILEDFMEKVNNSVPFHNASPDDVLIGIPPVYACIDDIVRGRVELSQVQLLILPEGAVHDHDLKMIGGGSQDFVEVQTELLLSGRCYAPGVFNQATPYGNNRAHWIVSPGESIPLESGSENTKGDEGGSVTSEELTDMFGGL
jgi:hypothetical protein